MITISSFDKLLGRFVFFIILLIIFRVAWSGTGRYVFLLWNIFLAWVPYILSNYFIHYRHNKKWEQVFLFCSWLLFFPNALYIITDLVHLQEENNMPWWYDTTLLFASSFVGMLMAFISLRRAEHYLGTFFSRHIVARCILTIIFIASFGVYLGRFQRWNSWDVVNNPLALGFDILSKMINPIEHARVWAITILFTIIYSLLYHTIKKIPQVISEIKNTG